MTTDVAQAFRPAVALLVAIALSGPSAIACGSGPISPSTGAQRTLVNDAIGDAVRPAGVTVAPDLVSAELQVTDGMLSATVTFAPGTFSRDQTAVGLFVDTDENQRTGLPLDGDSAFTWDYYVEYLHNFAFAGTTDGIFSNNLPFDFPGPDQVHITVPLALLGNDDGRLTFRIECAQADAITDVLPDVTLPPAVLH